jgi:enoyl-CoA hydratase/carnithine racemase
MQFETLKVRVDGPVVFVDIAAPPMNLLGPELVRDLVSLIQRTDARPAVQVLVFRSADPDYFIAHVDVTQVPKYRDEAVRLTGEPSLGMVFRHLSASRLVTIAQIEGRVGGAASAAPAASSPWLATCASPRAKQRSSGRWRPRSARSSVPEGCST